jgi:hypothetical protein
MSEITEFGFDDAKVIKAAGCEVYKQSHHKQSDRVCLIAFKKYIDIVLAAQTKKAGRPLTDQEKADWSDQVEAKLSERLKKPLDQLTDVDRLDIKQPKFAFGYTHYKEGIGTIRCKGTWENGVLVKPSICCKEMGDAMQTVATVILQYPVTPDGQVDMELLKMQKYTAPYIWKLGSQKFRKLEAVYLDARNDGRSTIDLRVTLDGDPKYQKQEIQLASASHWALEGSSPEVRNWILELGARNWKYVQNSLGFDMPMDKLIERLGAPQIGVNNSQDAQDRPKLTAGYETLLD